MSFTESPQVSDPSLPMENQSPVSPVRSIVDFSQTEFACNWAERSFNENIIHFSWQHQVESESKRLNISVTCTQCGFNNFHSIPSELLENPTAAVAEDSVNYLASANQFADSLSLSNFEDAEPTIETIPLNCIRVFNSKAESESEYCHVLWSNGEIRRELKSNINLAFTISESNFNATESQSDKLQKASKIIGMYYWEGKVSHDRDEYKNALAGREFDSLSFRKKAELTNKLYFCSHENGLFSFQFLWKEELPNKGKFLNATFIPDVERGDYETNILLENKICQICKRLLSSSAALEYHAKTHDEKIGDKRKEKNKERASKKRKNLISELPSNKKRH